jgi:hypothetical protein
MIKTILALAFVGVAFAQTYEAVKIDTHGGRDDYERGYGQGGFSKKFAKASDLLDKNATKSSGAKDWRK